MRVKPGKVVPVFPFRTRKPVRYSVEAPWLISEYQRKNHPRHRGLIVRSSRRLQRDRPACCARVPAIEASSMHHGHLM